MSQDRHAADLMAIQSSLNSFTLQQKYKVLKYIGRGSYGLVVAVRETESRTKRALKSVFPHVLCKSSRIAQRVLREIKILAHFSGHPNIVSIQNLICSPEGIEPARMFIVMDLSDMDLQAMMSSHQPFTEMHAQYFVAQILAALDYIHSAGVVHRDLTPANCLVNLNCDLKVCDFGLAREQTTDMTDYVVTRWFRAPELLLHCESYDSSIDIWSCGCIMAQLLNNGEPVFRGESESHQLQTIIGIVGTPHKDDLPPSASLQAASDAIRLLESLPACLGVSFASFFSTPEGNELSLPAVQLLRAMLAFNPQRRCTTRQGLQHSYLQEFCPASFPVAPQFVADDSAIIDNAGSASGSLFFRTATFDPQILLREVRLLQSKHGWGCSEELAATDAVVSNSKIEVNNNSGEWCDSPKQPQQQQEVSSSSAVSYATSLFCFTD